MIFALLFTIHLVLVGTAAWLPLIAMLLDFPREYPSDTKQIQFRLMLAALVALVAGAVTGLLMGWMSWDAAFSQALWAIGSRLPFGIVEFGFSVLAFAVFLAWIQLQAAPSRRIRWLRAALIFVALTNLWYHFPILLGVIDQLRKSSVSQVLSSAEFRDRAFSAQSLVSAAHFWLSQPIIGGIAAAWLLRTMPSSNRLLRASAVGGLVASLAQWPVGLMSFWQLSPSTQVELLHTAAVLAMVIVLGTTWMLIGCQVLLVYEPRSRRALAWTTLVLAVLLFQMSWLHQLS
jgi:hypothetical protein